jgi:hypothetical protein
MRGLDPQAATPSSCAATCATAAAWPAACAACHAAPLRSLAAAFAWPAAVRAWDIVISPRAQARACSIAWRGRGPQARADSKRSRTCSAHDARPQGVELVIRIGEGPTAADRYETRAAVFSAGSHRAPSARICPTCNTCPAGFQPAGQGTTGAHYGDVGTPSRHRPGGPSCGSEKSPSRGGPLFLGRFTPCRCGGGGGGCDSGEQR